MAKDGSEQAKEERFMCLQCHLLKFTDTVSVANTVDAHLSVEGLLSLSRNDGTTSIFRLKNGKVVCVYDGGTGLESCRRVHWDRWGQSGAQWSVLYTQDSSGSILELAVTGDTLTLQGQLLLPPLQTAMQDYSKSTVTSVQLVGYEKGYLLFLVNADTLCAAEVQDNICVPCAWIPLPVQHSDDLRVAMSSFRVIADMVVVMHVQSQLLVLYSLTDGQLLCQIDLQPAGFGGHSMEGGSDRVPPEVPWSLCPAVDRLVWQDTPTSILSLRLQDYIQAHPHALKLPEKPQGSHVHSGQTLRTCCRGGGFPWRQKLVQGHLQQGGSSKSAAAAAWSPTKLTCTSAGGKQGHTKTVAASGFRGKKRRREGEKGAVEGYLKRVRVPAGHPLELGYAVQEMQCSGAVVTMVMEEDGEGGDRRAVGMVNLLSGQVYFHSLPTDHCPILTATVGLPIMLLSPGGVVLLATSDTNHEDIVSKLMLHSGGRMTEGVCQLNGWRHSTVPVTALVQSLRQHQLDTTTFFLSSQQHVFSGHSGDLTTSVTWAEGAHLSAINELLPALDLFLKVINGDLPDMSPPREFRMRLLSQTLEFVYDLVKDGSVRHGQLTGSERQRAERDDLDSALEVVMGYVAQMRAAMMAEQRRQKRAALRPLTSVSVEKESVDSISIDTVDADLTEVVSYTEEEVEKACRGNELPTLQTQLLQQMDEHHAQWGEVVRVGVRRAWSHILSHDLTAAQNLLSCLGLNVCQTIWKLVQFTPDRQLQRYIIQQLKMASTLSPQDQKLVDYIHTLYSVYPASSLQHFVNYENHSCQEKWADSKLRGQVRTVHTQVSTEVGDVPSLTPTTPNTPPSDGPYCVLAVHWLRQLEVEAKEALLLDGAVLRKEVTEGRGFSPRGVWRYWLSRNQPQPAIQALEAAMATERGMLGRLLEDYLQDLPLASSFVRHEIKTHLLRKRVYRWEILQSLKTTREEQLRLVWGFLHTPHPLQGYSHSVLQHFHQQFAAYCVHHRLLLPLWAYCSLHGVDTGTLGDTPGVEEVLWFKPFLCLHAAVNQPHNLLAMCEGSLNLANVHWTPDDWTLATLLKHGHVTAAVATLAYLPPTCTITQENAGTQYSVDVPSLHTGLQRFPKLLSALLPPDADTSRFDINVYQLLRDNCPLHSTRLFGWQSTHTAVAEDGMKVLPYFSLPQLVSGFSHSTKINFTFYLKHGRPTYAFLSFLAEELEHKTSTLSPKRVAAACGMALWVCVKHFHQLSVSSACVAFVEMLGRDSTLLRTYLQAGETILTHRTRHLSGSAEKRKEATKVCQQEVVTLLQSCLRNGHRHGRQLLSVLEDAIADDVAREGLSGTSVEAALKWNVAMLLCHHLHLPLSTRYLETAARDDKWLPFLWFAHLHQFPKAQLQQVVHHFSGRHLRDHLHYIITNAGAHTVTSSAPTLSTSQPSARGSADGGHPSTKSSTEDSVHIRSSLYAKIGLHTADRDAGEESSEEEGEEEEVEEGRGRRDRSESLRSSSRRSSEDDMEVTEESTASDVFRVIFSALATGQPWKSLLMHAVVLRNPLFAELAACCNAPMVASLCAWLAAMLSPTEHARFVEHDGKRAWRWSERQLERLVEIYLQCHAENTLTAAFFIFQPTSPLLPFLQFVRECVFWRNYEGCKALLDNFKDAMTAISSTTSKSGKGKGRDRGEHSSDPAMVVIGDRDWLERVAYSVVQHQLTDCPSVHDAWHLLGLLAEENIALVFSFDVLDFGQLHKMLGVLHRRQVRDVHLPHLLTEGPDQQLYLQECHSALQALIAQGVYEDAYTFGQYAGLDLSGVVMRQLSSEKEQLQTSGVWKSAVIRRRYWQQCAATCERFQLPAAVVADFFQKEAEERESLREKSSLYRLSLTHVEGQMGRERTATDLRGLRDQIFTAMWRYTVQDRVARQQGTQHHQSEEGDIFSDVEDADSISKMSSSRQELLHTAHLPKPHVHPDNELNSEEAMELERMMGDLLAEGHVSQCCDLATLLGAHCDDLTIVLTCIGLSTGEITVATMDAASRLLLMTVERRRSLSSVVSFPQSSSSVSLASAAPNWGFLPPGQEEVIFTLEQLLSRCHKSQPCCLRIISIYKIACLIGRSYGEVVMAEEFSILRELLKTEFPHRYTLAAEFLSTSSLSDAEVAAFLVDEIIKSLRIYLGGKEGFDGGSDGRSGSGELIFRPTEGGQVFSQLVGLCGDPAVLGHCLLQALAALADQAAPQPSQEVLSMETELLIMAHECHTAACNMEGISNVLRAARVCAQGLASASQYHLMMRLLTGIGRYSEMTYIFDYLQHHHQFEMLLRKGIDKEDKLKTAILDYLKRFHSDDKDTYSMVALNFSMYREIADMLDDSGHRHLAQLKDKTLESSREIQDTLKKCIQYFGDAAESYAKDKCYLNAQKCLRWARLVNLQLHLLGSGVKVINLSHEEVKAFVATHPKFLEAYVVTEAYGRAVDWSDSLYNHVLMSADMRYLQDFRTYIKLTPSLIENTLYKLRHSPGKLTSCVGQVKKLLKLCPEVWLQYQMAQDLGLQDLTRDLLRNDTCSSYLKDVLALQ